MPASTLCGLRAASCAFFLSFLAACGGGGGSSGGAGSVASGGGTGSGGGSSGTADIAVTSLSTPANLVAGQEYTATGVISNLGDAGVIATSVQIVLLPHTNDLGDAGSLWGDVYLSSLGPGQQWNFSVTFDIPEDMPAGEYYLGAFALYDESNDSDYSNNFQSYPVNLESYVVCTNDAYEPDNGAGDSHGIVPGQSRTLNHCDATSDWLSFDAVEGTDYGITMVRGSGDSEMGLYGPDGVSLLAEGSWFGIGDDGDQLAWTAPQSGTYYIRTVSRWGLFGIDSSDYQVTLGYQDADLSVPGIYSYGSHYASTKVSVNGLVWNQGFVDSGSFKLGLFLSEDSDVTAEDQLLESKTVDGLLKEAELDFYFQEGVLPETPGEYYVAVIADYEQAVTESVLENNRSNVLPVSVTLPPGCSVDSYEPDDAAGSAQTIVVGGDPQSHNHCEDGTDWLVVDLEAGKPYMATKKGGGGQLQLYAPDGLTLLADSDSSTVLEWQSEAQGSYYLVVMNSSVGNGTNYEISVNLNQPDLSNASIYKPDTAGHDVTAGGVIDVASSVTNTGIANHDAFTVTWYLSEDSVVSTADLAIGSFDVDAGAIEPKGYYDYSYNYVRGDTMLYVPKATIPGLYYLAPIVDSGDAISEMDETNNVGTVIPVTVLAPECQPDVYEDDDSPETANPLQVGETQSRNLCDDGADWMSFVPDISGAYTVLADRFIDVYKQEGDTLLIQDDGLGRASWLAEAGATYLIYVNNLNPASTYLDPYTASVHYCPADEYEEDDDVSTASVIAVGESQSRNFCDDGIDWIAFQAVAGTTYDFATDDNSYYLLYDMDGETLIKARSMQGNKAVLNWTATVSGTYFVKVTGGMGINGDYMISLD